MEHVGKHFDLWDASMLKFDYLRVVKYAKQGGWYLTCMLNPSTSH